MSWSVTNWGLVRAPFFWGWTMADDRCSQTLCSVWLCLFCSSVILGVGLMVYDRCSFRGMSLAWYMRGPESWICSECSSLWELPTPDRFGVKVICGWLILLCWLLFSSWYLETMYPKTLASLFVSCWCLWFITHKVKVKKQSRNKRKLTIKVKQDMSKWPMLKMKHKNQILTMKEMIQEEHGWTWYKDRGKTGKRRGEKKMQRQNQIQRHDCKSETQIRNTCFTVVWVHCGHLQNRSASCRCCSPPTLMAVQECRSVSSSQSSAAYPQANLNVMSVDLFALTSSRFTLQTASQMTSTIRSKMSLCKSWDV